MSDLPTLHILNKPPGHPRFDACLSALAPQDQLLLIENAVLALADRDCTLPETVCALIADCQARGITVESTQAVDYPAMVGLTDQFSRAISW